MLKVRIRNFQSIADTSFEIDGFSVIVGKNNKGKSATIRAIDAALSNKLGNNFIKWGKTETQVDIQKDNLDITWVKGDTASYRVKVGEISKTYTSLKGAVPQPILDAGFRKLEIADEKLNPITAHQFDEIFLLNKSGPFITETISTLYDLNTLNNADTLCQKKLKTFKSTQKTRVSDLETLTNKLDKFKGLDDTKAQFDSIKIFKSKSDELRKDLNEIESFISQLNTQINIVSTLKKINEIKIPNIEKTNVLISDYQWALSALNQYNKLMVITQNMAPIGTIKVPDLSDTENIITENQWLINTEKTFEALIKSINALKSITKIKIPNLKKTEALLKEVSDVNALTDRLKTSVLSCNKYSLGLSDVKNLKPLLEKIKDTEAEVNKAAFLNSTLDGVRNLSQAIKNLDCDLFDAKEKLTEAQEELNTFEICPLCNSSLTPVHNHE